VGAKSLSIHSLRLIPWERTKIASAASSRCRLVVLCLIAVAACVHTMEPVSEGQQIRVQLSVGDTVRVLTKDSQRRVFKIVSLESDAMTGEDVRVPYADIVFLERRTFSPERTAAASAAGVLGTVVLVIGAYGAAVGAALSSPAGL